MPANPTPNFFSAARRVTDWAMPLVSSSNWFFILFLGFRLLPLTTGNSPKPYRVQSGWFIKARKHHLPEGCELVGLPAALSASRQNPDAIEAVARCQNIQLAGCIAQGDHVSRDGGPIRGTETGNVFQPIV